METKNTKLSDRKQAYIEKRKQLIALSKGVRQLIEAGEYDSVNEGLTDIYSQQDEEISEFNTFHQWKDKGYTIKKGEKAFLVWGQPRTVTQAPEGSEEPEEFKYWPVCYLFANTQVIRPEKSTQEQPAKKVKEKEPLPF